MFNQHPKGLYTLFFTEMWERMSYYGMRGILVLFMTASILEGGLQFDNVSASAIYGIYSACVYLVALLGGWLADRHIGQQKAILYGGMVIMLGHFLLAFTNLQTFYLGLIFVVLGTGLLKPNISAIVGGLYENDLNKKESGFTIFYMAINIGSVLGFFICGYLGENVGWHYGFGAAGIGMAFGLIQFILTKSNLGSVGLKPSIELNNETKKKELRIFNSFMLIFFLIILLGLFGHVSFDPIPIANILTVIILLIAIMYFLYLFSFGNLNEEERKKIVLIVVLFFGAAFFWSGFDQAGSSFNIFAKEYTDRIILGWEYPASWLQVLNPVLVVILSPFMAYMWLFLGKRMLDPSLPFKFGLGLIFMAIGFLFIATGATVAMQEGMAGAKWLLLTYLFHTIGELTLSPIGLAAISNLSPKRFVGQMMGIWFLASSLGAIIAGLLSGQATYSGINSMPDLFNKIAITSSIIGLVLILISKPLNNWVFKK
jgi:POT family proton-dependent oligopeptide transporter